MGKGRMRNIVHFSVHRLNRAERRSGYRFPGKIVAEAEWRGKTENKKGSFEAATSREPKEITTNETIA